MTPAEMVRHLQALEQAATDLAANDDLPPIEFGQLWMPADPYTAPRHVTHVGEGGHLGGHGEFHVHFTAGEGAEQLQLSRHFLEWVRLTGAQPEAVQAAANDATG